MEYNFQQFEIGSSQIYLLEFTDEFKPHHYLDTLTEKEKERFFEFKSLKRRQEFVATRILKHQLFGYQEIKYKDHGSPYFDEHHFISISHAQNIVGIATNENHAIAFDIEQIKPKISSLFHKFLNEKEKKIFNTNDLSELICCWSFKETLYKLAGRKLIDFKTELILLEKNDAFVKGKIINPNEEIFVDLHRFYFKNNVITINLNEVLYVRK